MSRNILVFMDGTRNKPSDRFQLKGTNVWKLYEASSVSQRGRETHAKYVRGVGTAREAQVDAPADDLRLFRIRHWNAPARVVKRAARQVARLPARAVLKYGASAVGWGVADRIREAYGFICRHYRPGDRVYLFGFSRGAFEARSLAGFVDAVGLLLRSQAVGPDARRLVDKAYEIYRRGDAESLRFLRTFLRRMTGRPAPGPDADAPRSPRFAGPTLVRLHFVGVWDTVEALGIGELRLGRWVLDSRSLPVVGAHTGYHLAAALPSNVRHGRHALAIHELRSRFAPMLFDPPLPGQDLRQVWFAGAHADVGGGYPDTRLSDLALNWMADEAARSAAPDTAPVDFDGMPVALSSALPLQPHHAVQGDFFWATPAPRTVLVDGTALAPEMAATMAVHPSALARLLDGEATTYHAYPFEKDFRWTRHLPAGDRYPADVRGALARLDDSTAVLQVALVAAEVHGLPDARPLDARPPGAAQAVLPAWRQVRTVAALRRAHDRLAAARTAFSRRGDEVEWLEAMGILLAFGCGPAIDRFLDDMADWGRTLEHEAQASGAHGARIRRRELRTFDVLCACAGTLRAASTSPAAWRPQTDRIHARLCGIRDDLRRMLPIEIVRPLHPRRWHLGD